MMENTHVCPWQTGNLLMLSARRFVHNPNRILGPHIVEGMTVMDVGCGMGYFTVPMAQMVGESGKVIATDLQPEMLDGMLLNAEKAKVRNRIEQRLCGKASMDIGDLDGKVHFAILFMMLHEVPDRERLVHEVCDTLELGGKLLFAEPVVHVGKESFERSLQIMRQAGLVAIGAPSIALCRAALLENVPGSIDIVSRQ